jgi:hypothetical protein
MGIDLAKIKAKIAQLNGENKGDKGGSNVQMWKPGPGEYTIRCVHWPEGVTGDGEFAKELFFYYGVGSRPILAPDQFDKEDPIKDLRMKLFQSGTPSDKELAKKLFPKMRAYVPVIVLEGPGADPERVIVWSFGTMVYQKLLGYFMNEKVGDYFDPKNGFNLTVKITQVKGKQFSDTSIELDALTGRCPLNSDTSKVKTILASIPDISKMWELKDAATLQRDLDSWLNGESNIDVSKDTAGTAKGSEKVDLDDQLDKLAAKKAPAVEEKPAKQKKAEPVAKAKVVEEDVETPATSELDAAFQDLMDD